MATYYSDAVLAGVMPDQATAGHTLCRTATYLPTVELPANTVVQMVPIPKDAMVLWVEFGVNAASKSATTTVDVGDADVDRYLDGVNIYTAAARYGVDDNKIAGLNKVYATNDTIDAKILGSALTTNVTMTLNVYYKMVGTITDETP